MKQWNRPIIGELEVGFTAEGSAGLEADLVQFDIDGKLGYGLNEGSSLRDKYRPIFP
jgi:hypothetical protein